MFAGYAGLIVGFIVRCLVIMMYFSLRHLSICMFDVKHKRQDSDLMLNLV